MEFTQDMGIQPDPFAFTAPSPAWPVLGPLNLQTTAELPMPGLVPRTLFTEPLSYQANPFVSFSTSEPLLAMGFSTTHGSFLLEGLVGGPNQTQSENERYLAQVDVLLDGWLLGGVSADVYTSLIEMRDLLREVKNRLG